MAVSSRIDNSEHGASTPPVRGRYASSIKLCYEQSSLSPTSIKQTSGIYIVKFCRSVDLSTG